MSARVYLKNMPVMLDKQVGHPGGQATVYQLNVQQVVKVYDEDQRQHTGRLTTALRADLYRNVSNVAAVPTALTYDSLLRREVTGYVMKYLDGYVQLADILCRDGRCAEKLYITDMVRIFTLLHGMIEQCHRQGFVLGDLNARNIMVKCDRAKPDVQFIDVDSWGCVEGSKVGQQPVVALDPAIDHPKLSIDGLKGAQLDERMRERDWFVFVLHLAHGLCGFSPFEAGFIPGPMLSPVERMQKGLTIWNRGVRLTVNENYAALRLGPKMIFVLKNWLAARARGVFPLHELQRFAEGLRTCPKCRFKVHRSVGRCVRCFTLLP